jgi:hypothetical protein
MPVVAELRSALELHARARGQDRQEQLTKARATNQHLTDLNSSYAAIINQLAEDLEAVTAERDALTSTTDITQLRRRRRDGPQI